MSNENNQLVIDPTEFNLHIAGLGEGLGGDRFTLNEEQLFKRLTQLEKDKLTISADIAQLKKDAAYDEDDNPKGLEKDEIKLIAAAAKYNAKQDFEEKRMAANAVFAKYEELTNYND